jgi:hypothetical protein
MNMAGPTLKDAVEAWDAWQRNPSVATRDEFIALMDGARKVTHPSVKRPASLPLWPASDSSQAPLPRERNDTHDE